MGTMRTIQISDLMKLKDQDLVNHQMPFESIYKRRSKFNIIQIREKSFCGYFDDFKIKSFPITEATNFMISESTPNVRLTLYVKEGVARIFDTNGHLIPISKMNGLNIAFDVALIQGRYFP